MEHKQDGAMHYVLLILILIAATVGFAGYKVMTTQQNEKHAGTDTNEQPPPVNNFKGETEAKIKKSDSKRYENIYYSFDYPTDWHLFKFGDDFCLFSPEIITEPTALQKCSTIGQTGLVIVSMVNPSSSIAGMSITGSYHRWDTNNEPITPDGSWLIQPEAKVYKFEGAVQASPPIYALGYRLSYQDGRWMFLSRSSATVSSQYDQSFLDIIKSIELKQDWRTEYELRARGG